MNKVVPQLVSKSEFQAIGSEMGQCLRQFRTTMSHEMALLRLEMRIELLDSQLRLVKWIGSMLIVQAWIIVLVKLL